MRTRMKRVVDHPRAGRPGVTPRGGSAYAEAVVDLDAIAHNTSVLAERTGPAALMAVVKADGFGHGAVQVARTALACGASWLGVTSLSEALRLRDGGIDARILSWLHLPGEDFAPAVAAGVDLGIPSIPHLLGVAGGAKRAGVKARVHLEIDTGLRRGGVSPADWTELVAAARTLERRGLVQVHGLWSHLVQADLPGHPTTTAQMRLFEAAAHDARKAGLRPDLMHLANSAGGLAAPATHYDLVRAGLGLYGVEPVRGQNFGLRPAMTLRGRAIMTRGALGGDGISYGHSYITQRPTELLLVPLGFADGIPRAAGGQAQMWIAGGRRPVVGRIAMDQCVVDIGDVPVETGEEVVVFGTGEAGEPTAAEWARWAGTVPHEVLTGVGPRVPRRYLPAATAGPDGAGTTTSGNEWIQEGDTHV